MSSLRIQYSPLTIHSDSDGVMQIEAIARHSGVLKYRSDSGDRLELVPDDLILATDDEDKPVMGWIAGAVATNEHPPGVMVRYNEDAKKAYQVGTVADDVHIYKDSNGVRKVKVRIDVADPVTQQEIRDGKKKGVSMGYMCGVKADSGEWNGQKYTHVQEMPLKIDHLAIVANPRAPEALITRFDSDDISDSDVAWAVAEEEPVVTPSMRIIHVDACCAACEAAEKSDEEKPGIKKKATKPKKDSDEQMTTAVMERSDTEVTPESVTHIKFNTGMVAVPDRLLNSLHADGIIEVVELAGEEFLVGADFANQLRADGLIEHEDANCQGNGWVPGGPNGKCKRAPKGANTKAGAAKAAAGAASLKKFGKSNLNAQNAARLAELRKKKGLTGQTAKTISGNLGKTKAPGMSYGAVASASSRLAKKGGRAKVEAAAKKASATKASEKRLNESAQRSAERLFAEMEAGKAGGKKSGKFKSRTSKPLDVANSISRMRGNDNSRITFSEQVVNRRMKAAKQAKEQKAKDLIKAKRSASAKKGAATRKAKKAASASA